MFLELLARGLSWSGLLPDQKKKKKKKQKWNSDELNKAAFLFFKVIIILSSPAQDWLFLTNCDRVKHQGIACSDYSQFEKRNVKNTHTHKKKIKNQQH